MHGLEFFSFFFIYDTHSLSERETGNILDGVIILDYTGFQKGDLRSIIVVWVAYTFHTQNVPIILGQKKLILLLILSHNICSSCKHIWYTKCTNYFGTKLIFCYLSYNICSSCRQISHTKCTNYFGTYIIFLYNYPIIVYTFYYKFRTQNVPNILEQRWYFTIFSVTELSLVINRELLRPG